MRKRIKKLYLTCLTVITCINCARAQNNLTHEEQNLMLKLHNQYRMGEGASDMIYMRWNNDLAELAQIYADGCDFRHGKPESVILTDYNGSSRYGQNLWARTGRVVSMDQVVGPWFYEKEDYDYNTRECSPGKKCGHYTQVVQAHSYDLGCGRSRCEPLINTRIEEADKTLFSAAWYVVCHYGPMGNIQDVGPFKKGAPCTECESKKYSCREKMCDDCTVGENNCTCEASAACKNCASVTADCQCQCYPGFTGPTCTDVCEDKNDNCNTPYYLSKCHKYSVYKNCAVTCGRCEPHNDSLPVCQESSLAESLHKQQDLLHGALAVLVTILNFLPILYDPVLLQSFQ